MKFGKCQGPVPCKSGPGALNPVFQKRYTIKIISWALDFGRVAL